MRFLLLPILIITLLACSRPQKYPVAEASDITKAQLDIPQQSIILLGTIQDGGSPHIGCQKSCCKDLFKTPGPSRMVISLGLYDQHAQKKYLFEATPDIAQQLKMLKNFGQEFPSEMPDGIFLTHGHIGHYTGLMYLGKEAMNADSVPVFAMPRMKTYLEENGPWSQLVSQQNISLILLKNEKPIQLTPHIKVTPITVPHRDEFTETVGFKIQGPNKNALFIPDIDKWQKWDKDILSQIKEVDYAFLDATFFSGEEINTRDITQIPHPFIIESMEKFKVLSKADKAKVIFIHFNHTNPVIDLNSSAARKVLEKGFRIGQLNEVFGL
ncbi:MBL fold metallo-hydrolase [Echinicola soli]|uniref:MBL fold metallo-hydrolase n=1 Tax=Echinicola soli TaxID=2591634 RepID=A0A514CGB9_9BACT|nr:MBL fold metallo-hydrolase [Echinicola soli]QDH78871.1 MBL fold metallo-hydrolase [Echinicola soli]